MKVVLIFNGLGNQMSQYAFYLAQKQKQRNVIYLYQPPTSRPDHNGYELDNVFSIPRNTFFNFIVGFFYRIYIRKPRLRNLLGNKVTVWEENYNYDYNPNVFDNKTFLCFYYGGWHSEKYFYDIKPIIKDSFKFNLGKINRNTQKWSALITEVPQSVAVHVRRGDFVDHWMWKNIADEEYYKRAFRYVLEKTKDAVFFVFSNDIEWCKNTFRNLPVMYVDGNQKEDSWQDLYLMTLCHHHINANSTFSWWGAWLSDFDDSIVIVPSKFRNDIIAKDIYPDSWIKL